MLLKNIAVHPIFLAAAAAAYHRINQFNADPHDAMEELTVDMAEEFGLYTDIAEDCAVFWHASARSEKPACITIAPNDGQTPSPNAVFVAVTATFVVQVFKTGADDAGLDDSGAGTGYRLETEGRVLFA